MEQGHDGEAIESLSQVMLYHYQADQLVKPLYDGVAQFPENGGSKLSVALIWENSEGIFDSGNDLSVCCDCGAGWKWGSS